MTSVARSNPYSPGGTSASSTLLVQIREAHEDLHFAVAHIDAITRCAFPEDASFSNARWRISQASLRRRTTAARIFDFLISRSHDQDNTDKLKSLQAADQQMMRRSAEHVCTWTAQSIRKNWQGYCDASRDLRTHMKSYLLAEQRTLYPLLEGAVREI